MYVGLGLAAVLGGAMWIYGSARQKEHDSVMKATRKALAEVEERKLHKKWGI
jgi:hypothetical protein